MGRTQRLRKRIRRLTWRRGSDAKYWRLLVVAPGSHRLCWHSVPKYVKAGWKCPDSDEFGMCNEIPF